MSAVTPSEGIVMANLGKELPQIQSAQSDAREQSYFDAEETLPWDQAQHDATCEAAAPALLETDTRPSPEGSIKEAILGSASEAFLKTPKDKGDESSRPASSPAHVCVPLDPLCIERPPSGDKKPLRRSWELEGWMRSQEDHLEKQTFLAQSFSAHVDDLPGCPRERPKASCCESLACYQATPCSHAGLKAVASMVGALVIFPCLIYGAYVFLPFDAPAMTTMSARLVYTLRCGAFATFPIVLGIAVYGVSRLCTSSLQPFGELQKEAEIHQRYVSQSVDLFILYFFNIAVLSTYLPQEALKLVPLLTALFAISRLLYWMAYSMGRSFRGFGFGLTFFPLAAMLVFNLYSMFLVDVESVFATAGGSPPEEEQRLAASRPRYWG